MLLGAVFPRISGATHSELSGLPFSRHDATLNLALYAAALKLEQASAPVPGVMLLRDDAGPAISASLAALADSGWLQRLPGVEGASAQCFEATPRLVDLLTAYENFLHPGHRPALAGPAQAVEMFDEYGVFPGRPLAFAGVD